MLAIYSYQDEIQHAYGELKTRRNTRLKQLYEEESKVWEKELAVKGLAIYKNKL